MGAGHILIVEDERLVAEDLRRALNAFGYRVTGTAVSASGVVQKIEDQPPDLVLMDIRLQGECDGIAAADWIRQRYDIPVIYLSAHTDDLTLHRAKATHPYGFVVKPFQRQQLRSSVEVALAKHRSEKESSKKGEIPALQLSLQSISYDLSEIKSRLRAAADSEKLMDLGTQYGLTRRELETLRLLATGHRVVSIAEVLELSSNTIRNHLKGVFRKFGVHSQVELIGRLRELTTE